MADDLVCMKVYNWLAADGPGTGKLFVHNGGSAARNMKKPHNQPCVGWQDHVPGEYGYLDVAWGYSFSYSNGIVYPVSNLILEPGEKPPLYKNLHIALTLPNKPSAENLETMNDINYDTIINIDLVHWQGDSPSVHTYESKK